MSYKDTSLYSSNISKAFQFYKNCVELERRKSVESGKHYSYSILENVEDKKCILSFDLMEDPDFWIAFQQNGDKSMTKWPKHLSIGLDIIWENQRYRLLQYIYLYEDLQKLNENTHKIAIELSMLEMSPDAANDLEISIETVNEINAFIRRSAHCISDIEAFLQEKIDRSLILDNKAFLSLTAESIALSQIDSELKHLESLPESLLLNCFLSGIITNNTVSSIPEECLIQINEMDPSQRKAVASALNNKISVITGPPGTGKTQMIMNLMINAMLNGKSVLIASKNNKAVDNIKDRFDLIDEHQYVLRFGARSTIQNQLLPFLNSLCMTKSVGNADDSVSYEFRNKYQESCRIIERNKGQLRNLAELKQRLESCQNRIKQLNQEKELIQKRFSTQKINLLQRYADVKDIYEIPLEWKKEMIDLTKSLNKMMSKLQGIRKFFFNWLWRKEYTERILDRISDYPEDLYALITEKSKIRFITDVRNGNDLIELYKIILNYFDRIIDLRKQAHLMSINRTEAIIPTEKRLESERMTEADLTGKISVLSEKEEAIRQEITAETATIAKSGLDLMKELIDAGLKRKDLVPRIVKYKNYLPNNIPWKRDEMKEFYCNAEAFIELFRLCSVTNLSIKNAFPLKDGIFDMVIIDEASQCDIASALPLIYRAKQLVVVGDPLQLKHISAVSPEDEANLRRKFEVEYLPHIRYCQPSLWDYCNDLICSATTPEKPVILDYHYRCHPDIIGYSNEMFYAQRLGVKLKVKSVDRHPEMEEKGIMWIDVKGRQYSPSRNLNEQEADTAVTLATRLAEKYPEISIGIISPFKHQAERINYKIPAEYRESERIVADTVHKFQGDEKDVIIYSLVVTDNSPSSKIRWIDYSTPNLVNVAVTRARSVLYVVGNKEYIQSHSSLDRPLGYLVNYASRIR